MKKVFYLAAVAAFAFFSCQKETSPSPQSADNNKLTFKASFEQLEDATKGTINASNGLVWAKNDMIGIYFPNWGDKNQPFRLNETDAGKTEGNFTIATSANPSGATATAAYFPWWDTESFSTAYPSSSQTNVYNGIVYFKMKSDYYGYSNGRMLTPLVAPIASSSDKIAFKHAGAAVKVTINNNLVSGTYHAKMSVTGKQISGDFKVDPANAGTEALALDADEDIDKNNVTLHAYMGSGPFSWIFPVPELTKPKLQFEIKDENGVIVWSKNLKAQAEDLKRRDLLVMPALDITPYSKFVKDETTWTFSGTINGSAWQDNVPMMTDGKVWILAGCTFKAGDKFKIRKDNDWVVSYPSEDWLFTDALAGSKDIIFDPNATGDKIKVVAHKFPYPEVDLSYLSTSSITIDGDMTDWTFVKGLPSNNNGTGRIRSWKYTSKDDICFFYFVLRKNRMSTAHTLSIGFDYADGGSKVDNLSGYDTYIKFQPFTNADGTPTCINGTISTANINGTDQTGLAIKAWGYDPNDNATDDNADYYLEVSIPRSILTGLPANGTTVNIGAGCDGYNTGLQSVTL